MGALAQSAPVPPDVSVTSVGLQTWTDTAIRGNEALTPTDMDVVVGERMRWTLAGDRLEPGTDVVALVDGRFTIDPQPTPVATGLAANRFEWSQVRQAGIEIATDQWTIDLGRHPVYRGGPRLVDGVQALYAPSPTVRVGVWGGLAPDLFTTLPALRPGGGPIVSYATSKVQLSAVGDVVTYAGGLDRVGLLTIGRVSFERRLDLSARIDVEAVGPVGARLVDGQLVAIGNPAPSLRLDALYDAFSSYRYVDLTDLDPDVSRFADRLSDAGAQPIVPYDQPNTRLNHLVGAGIRFEPDTNDVAPRLAFAARYRATPPGAPAVATIPGATVPATGATPVAPVGTAADPTGLATVDPANTWLRLNPQAGVVRVAGMIDLLADLNYIVQAEGDQLDGGVTVYVAPPDASVSVDASARLLLAPDDIAPFGWYGDLFLNVVSPDLDLLIIAGGMVSSEPDVIDLQPDLGFGAFVRIAKYLRPPR